MTEIVRRQELLETDPPTVEELSLAYDEVATSATKRVVPFVSELERFKNIKAAGTSFINDAYRDLIKWSGAIEDSNLIGRDRAISPAILGFQRDAINLAETIKERMRQEDRMVATPEEEMALAARYFHWRAARHDWQDHKAEG